MSNRSQRKNLRKKLRRNFIREHGRDWTDDERAEIMRRETAVNCWGADAPLRYIDSFGKERVHVRRGFLPPPEPVS